MIPKMKEERLEIVCPAGTFGKRKGVETDQPGDFHPLHEGASLKVLSPVQIFQIAGMELWVRSLLIGEILTTLTVEQGEKLLHMSKTDDELNVGKIEPHVFVVSACPEKSIERDAQATVDGQIARQRVPARRQIGSPHPARPPMGRREAGAVLQQNARNAEGGGTGLHLRIHSDGKHRVLVKQQQPVVVMFKGIGRRTIVGNGESAVRRVADIHRMGRNATHVLLKIFGGIVIDHEGFQRQTGQEVPICRGVCQLDFVDDNDGKYFAFSHFGGFKSQSYEFNQRRNP